MAPRAVTKVSWAASRARSGSPEMPKADSGDEVLELSDEAAERRSVAALGLPYPLAYLFRFHLVLQEHFTASTVTGLGIGYRRFWSV